MPLTTTLPALRFSADLRPEPVDVTRIGPYRPVKLLGQGGMASVWLATDSRTGDARFVALKVPTRGQLAVHARFTRECAILSTLDHPNIARLIEAGSDADGWPYLAMEFVDGVPIDRWCIEQNLDCPAILRLFVQVLDAVQHAHEQLVLHRDLKPSNILVTPQGTIKLLDFGIAKLLYPDADTATQVTQCIGQAWTPAYAAPEMHSGDGKPGIATEVYALGVVLYELLTRQSPYQAAFDKGWTLKRSVTEHRPAAPSRSLHTHPLSGDAQWRRGARHALRGPVDQMVLTALRKTPRLRYESAGAWARDIHDHLQGRPIQAAREPALRRLRSTMQEHRLLLQTASLICGISLAGTAAAWWQATEAKAAQARAEAHFNHLRKLSTSLLFEVYRDIEWLPGADKARLAIASSAQTHLDRLLAEDLRNPDLMMELAHAYSTLAHAQANNVSFDRHQALGNYRQAWNLATRALNEPHPPSTHLLGAIRIGLRMANLQVDLLDSDAAATQFGEVGRLFDRHDREVPNADRHAVRGEVEILRFGFHTSKAGLLMLDASGREASERELTSARDGLARLEQGGGSTPQMVQRLRGDLDRFEADWRMEYAAGDELIPSVIPLLERSVQAWVPLSTREARLQQRIIAAELQITETLILAGQATPAWASLDRWSTPLDDLLSRDPEQSVLPTFAARRDLFKARLLLARQQPQQARPHLDAAAAHLKAMAGKSSYELLQTLLDAELAYLRALAAPSDPTSGRQALEPARQALEDLAQRKMLNRYGRSLLTGIGALATVSGQGGQNQ